MKLEKLYLEVTRMCTLECEHCLRGNREKEFMSLETIRNVFSNVKEVDTLLITGGEPLIAIKQISEIIKAIYNNNVKVNDMKLNISFYYGDGSPFNFKRAKIKWKRYLDCTKKWSKKLG